MYIAILGRQPKLGAAELESIYGADAVSFWNPETATVDVESFDFERLGGTQKAGRVISTLPTTRYDDISRWLVEHYTAEWQNVDHKITLGISAYHERARERDVQKIGITLKKRLRESGVSLRLIPNAAPALNTATSHHNKLGLSPNKVELLLVPGRRGQTIIAESIGAQNITALSMRDQARPHTDAFVGMLPPKLARMMVNMTPLESGARILDPFCGTGVLLQEAALLGHPVYGSDLSEKMVDYSTKNLAWLQQKYPHHTIESTVELGDATKHRWNDQIDAVICETYLGQPFSAPPKPEKLADVRRTCNAIISSFLTNIHSQLAEGTPLTVAVPAWRDANGRITRLPLVHSLEKLGYEPRKLSLVPDTELLYYRTDQVVARDILLLRRK